MTRRKFDRVMVHIGAGQHLKLRPLDDSEWRCFIGGVLAIAADAPIRGCLLVGDRPATPEDVAHQAGVKKPKAAGTALDKLRDLGIVYRDEENDCERVHDFEDWNPAPKVDRTAAERARRYRERVAAKKAVTNAAVTDASRVTNGAHHATVTATEGEGEGEAPQSPPEGGQVIKFGRKTVPTRRVHLAEQILARFNDLAKTGYGPYSGDGNDRTASEALKRIIGALTAAPDLDFDEADRMIRWQLQHPFWDGKPHPGVVFGPGVVEKARESAASMAPANRGSVADRAEAAQAKRDQANAEARALREAQWAQEAQS